MEEGERNTEKRGEHSESKGWKTLEEEEKCRFPVTDICSMQFVEKESTN